MLATQVENEESAHAAALVEPARALKFGKDPGFHNEVRRRVDEFFQATGRRKRDCWQMYLKTAIILTSFFGFYVLLVFFAQTWWQALPLAILLGLATAEIGFNIQHDAGHYGYSNHPWVNKFMAMMLDMIGGSSYLWHWKHAVLHHTYVNITSHDTDIDLGVLGRLTPHQSRFRFHRWQHFYLWPLYGLMAIKWHLYDDFQVVLAGRIGPHRFPRPRGWDLAIFWGGKVIFVAMAFLIPMWFHPPLVVAFFYGVTAFVLGIVLSVVFQLAHCVEEAEFPQPRAGSDRVEHAWAIHQVETTVDFARRSRLVSWLVGGLNFQIEHHLFPRICHIHYPAISPVVEQTCREYGVKFTEHPSLGAGVASHFRWLRKMGSRNAAESRT